MSGGLAEAVGGENDTGAMLREVLEGLLASPKRISSKYHYDERGSKLFEQITRLEEYYPTRTERALLTRWMPVWVDELEPRALVELGAGSAEKTRIVLDSMVAAKTGERYLPVDVSDTFLQATARQLAPDYPSLAIEPIVADISAAFVTPNGLPTPSWIAFLGSTLGNFDRDGSVELLRRIRARLRPADRLLLGVDLRPGPDKSVERIELAYNDSAGVTAQFSLNVLSVLNAEVGTDFDSGSFLHRSYYNADEGRIETYLVSTADQTVSFPDGTQVPFREGEAVRTEISSKYDRSTVDDLFGAAGLEVDRWVEDDRGYYALVLGRPSRRAGTG